MKREVRQIARVNEDRERLIAVMITLALATAFKLWLAVSTFGTNDVVTWQGFAAVIAEHGGLELYYTVDLYNHPPFMIHALRVMTWLAQQTGIDFPFWLRIPAILADVGTVVLLWRMVLHRDDPRMSWIAVVLLAAAPPSLMISGFHGNTDPLMIFFVVLSVYLLSRGYHPMLAGAALGMSMNIKVVPVIFLPAILLYLPHLRARIAYLASAGVVFGTASLPYLADDPQFIAQRIFGYGSNYGQWGVSRILVLLAPQGALWAQLNDAYAQFGRFVALGSIVLVALWMNWRPRKVPLSAQCGTVAFLFLTLSPGFGVQYLAWLVPWAVIAGAGVAFLFYGTAGLLLFLVYTFWSGGVAWHFADSPDYGWRGYIIAFDLLCWVTVLGVTIRLLQRMRDQPVPPEIAEDTGERYSEQQLWR